MASRRRTPGKRGDGGGDATRKALLDAAVACLIDLGVAGTTTLAVQRRAGVSRGALLHHFPNRATLLAATVAELVKRNEQAVALALSRAPKPGDSLDLAVSALAFAARQPAYLAELELWAVARTDRALRRALVSAERAARRETDRVSAQLFGKWTESGAYQDVAVLTQHFIRGLAISENLRSSAEQRERLICAWAEAMQPMLERASEKEIRRGSRGRRM